jgi:hypothetical protein
MNICMILLTAPLTGNPVHVNVGNITFVVRAEPRGVCWGEKATSAVWTTSGKAACVKESAEEVIKKIDSKCKG